MRVFRFSPKVSQETEVNMMTLFLFIKMYCLLVTLNPTPSALTSILGELPSNQPYWLFKIVCGCLSQLHIILHIVLSYSHEYHHSSLTLALSGFFHLLLSVIDDHLGSLECVCSVEFCDPSLIFTYFY